MTRYNVQTPYTTTQYHAHLSLMHGVWTRDVKDLQELIECHEACHTEPIGVERPHTHQPPDDTWEW